MVASNAEVRSAMLLENAVTGSGCTFVHLLDVCCMYSCQYLMS